MNLKHLSNQELHESAIKSASHARLATTALLHHLCEVQRRRAFAEFGCESLFSYCVKHLGMDNPEAARHVNAARLMAEFPEIEEKINSSSMSLTSVSQAQVFFKQEAKLKTPASKEKKREVLEKIENKSTREVESILRAHSSSPEKIVTEKVRVISEWLTEVTTTFDKETIDALDRLKEVWSHSLPGAKYSEIIKKAVREACERHDPQLKAERVMERKLKKEDKAAGKKAEASSIKAEAAQNSERSSTAPDLNSRTDVSAKANVNPNMNASADLSIDVSRSFRAEQREGGQKRSRYIHSTVKHAVWMRDRGGCTYVDPRTGVRCVSRHHLQLDHILPYALGGANSVENLRLRCHAHNQLHAIRTYGMEVLTYAKF